MTANTPRIDDLMLGATNPKKVVHHEGCRHGVTVYEWARRQQTPSALFQALLADGAWTWHRFCQSCCGDLDDAFRWHAGFRIEADPYFSDSAAEDRREFESRMP